MLTGNQADSAPSVSGVSVGPTSISITGADFGTRANTPAYYNDFDSETIGQIPSDQTTNIASFGTVESNVYRGAKSLEFNWNTSDSESFQRNVVDIGAGGSDKIFVSMWVYMDKTGTTATDFQLKGVYATSCSDYYSCYTAESSWVLFNHFWEDMPRWYNSTAALVYGWDGSTMDSLSSAANPSDAWLWGEWQRVDYYMQRSSTGLAADGIMYWNRVGRSTPMVNQTTVPTHYDGNSEWRYVSIVQGVASIAGGTLDYDVYVDDVYMDTSRARVEICDVATWANRTHCEIQPSVEWSDTGITATLNSGSFAIGATAYAIVVDSFGAASNGEAVTIPGGPQSRGTVPLGDMR